MNTLEGKLTFGQAIIKIGIPVVSFVGGIFLYRYVNMAFDLIHGEKPKVEGFPNR